MLSITDVIQVKFFTFRNKESKGEIKENRQYFSGDSRLLRFKYMIPAFLLCEAIIIISPPLCFTEYEGHVLYTHASSRDLLLIIVLPE